MDMFHHLYVGIDIGSHYHQVAICDGEGKLVDEFTITHDASGFEHFFSRLASLQENTGLSVLIAMEGLNGHARPLDSLIHQSGYPLYNVNNLKLNRFKEIFPAPAKTDRIDARYIAQLLRLSPVLNHKKEALQLVTSVPSENKQLKRLTRRRRQLVREKVMILNRMYDDLQATAPGLSNITTTRDARWFLCFLTSCSQLTQLATMEEKSLLAIPGVGKVYARKIQSWQKQASFSADQELVSPMIIADAQRILALKEAIARLHQAISSLVSQSSLASLIQTIPGFGLISSAELAGEIGDISRFPSERSLALYLGMAPLDNSSGCQQGGRSARQVNKRAKLAMLTGAAHNAQMCPQSQAYYLKKRGEGKRHNQAVRALGRHLVRVIWSMANQERAYEIHQIKEDNKDGYLIPTP